MVSGGLRLYRKIFDIFICIEYNICGGVNMVLADWIFLGGLLLCIAIGALLGFGKVLSALVLNKGVRIIVAIFVCYSFGGMILAIPAVTNLLAELSAKWAHIDILIDIHLDIIIYYIVLFLITMLIIWILSKIVKGVSEIEVLPVKILNKVAGAILFTAFALALMLLAFQIIIWIGGNTATSFAEKISDSTIIKPLFENNPLLKLVEIIKRK